MEVGWPKHDKNGTYLGPLLPFKGSAERLIGLDGREFKTSSTAAWPPMLCDELANLVTETVMKASTPARALANGDTELRGKGKEEELQQAQEQKGIKRNIDEGCIQEGPPASTSAPTPATAAKTTRRKITDVEFRTLARGEKLTDGTVYIGRGGRGVAASKWGNPFKVGRRGVRLLRL